MGNQMPNDEKDTQETTDESSNRSKGNSMLDYTMKALVDAAVFSVHKIAPEVIDFLSRVGMFEASNGIRIKNGYAYNEWKESQNLIYLNARVIDRPDVTRFPTNGRKIRDNKIAMFNTAMKELADEVVLRYKGPIVESQIKADGRYRF